MTIRDRVFLNVKLDAPYQLEEMPRQLWLKDLVKDVLFNRKWSLPGVFLGYILVLGIRW